MFYGLFSIVAGLVGLVIMLLVVSGSFYAASSLVFWAVGVLLPRRRDPRPPRQANS